MDLIISSTTLERIITRAYNEGARQTLSYLGKTKASYSHREAEKIYGKSRFNGWITAGKLYSIRTTTVEAKTQSRNHKKSYLISDCEKLLAADEFKIKVKTS